MHYWAKIEKREDDGYYFVSFPDYPSVNTFGFTLEHAIEMGREALLVCLEIDYERGFELLESKEHSGDEFYKIEVPEELVRLYEGRGK